MSRFKPTPVTADALKKMTKAQKRVLIAKDVLARLDAGLLLPACGEYLIATGDFHDREQQVGDAIKDNRCFVCAIGATFVCAVIRFDRLKIEDLYDKGPSSSRLKLEQNEAYEYLNGLFTERALGLMEAAFEGRDVREVLSLIEEDDAAAFRNKFESSRERLRAIMKNIVRNKGSFRPKQEPRNSGVV